MSETVFQNAAPTKIVSARLPIPEYIKFLNAATDAKMSVSEFFYYKIYQDDKVSELAKALSEAQQSAKQYENIANENLASMQSFAAEIKKLRSEVTGYKTQISALSDAEKRYKGEISTDSKTITELKAKVQQLDAENKKLSEIIAQWSAKYDGLVKVCAGVKAQVLEYIRTEMFGGTALKNIINKLP